MANLTERLLDIQGEAPNTIHDIITRLDDIKNKQDSTLTVLGSMSGILGTIATLSGNLPAILGTLQGSEGPTAIQVLASIAAAQVLTNTKLDAVVSNTASIGAGEILLPTLQDIAATSFASSEALTSSNEGTALWLLQEINWALGGHPYDSLLLLTVRGLLARLLDLNEEQALLLGKRQSPAGVCSPSFASRGTKFYSSSEINRTVATWGSLSPRGVLINDGAESLALEAGAWRVYVDSEAAFFYMSMESETPLAVKTWANITGPIEISPSTEGDAYLTAYVCGGGSGGGDPDPEPDECVDCSPWDGDLSKRLQGRSFTYREGEGVGFGRQFWNVPPPSGGLWERATHSSGFTVFRPASSSASICVKYSGFNGNGGEDALNRLGLMQYTSLDDVDPTQDYLMSLGQTSECALRAMYNSEWYTIEAWATTGFNINESPLDCNVQLYFNTVPE